MAELSQDQPAFDWIMTHMDSLRAEFVDRWIICDGNGFIASQTHLDELLHTVSDRSPDELAIAFMKPDPSTTDDPGGWGLEPPLQAQHWQPPTYRAAES